MAVVLTLRRLDLSPDSLPDSSEGCQRVGFNAADESVDVLLSHLSVSGTSLLRWLAIPL